MLVDQDDLSVRRGNGFGVSLRICHLVSGSFCQLIQACLMGIEGSIPPHNRPQIIFFAFISYFLLWDCFVIC